ncbi:MAG: glycosyltransferase [Verrucomicrobiales bacterium]|nr:glycosyltransferase [Verrucomicrobiales bacterium]
MPQSTSPQPVVACYCSTFLAAEMQHVYRQITGLKEFRPLVLTRKRLNAELFPFPADALIELPQPSALKREWRRFTSRRVAQAPPFLFESEIRNLEKILREHQAAVLHIYFGNSGVELLPLLKSPTRPCPAVVSFHGADAGVDLEKPAWREAMMTVFERAEAILARSEALAADLRDLGCPPEKLTVQRAGIPLDEWPLTQRSAPVDGAWRFVQSGRLIEKKGYDTTLRAFARFREVHPQARLVILGEGPLLESLRRLANDLDINRFVTFAGFVEQGRVRSEYGWAHAFLHPSRTAGDGNREGVPNAILEAMATGLPILSTSHGGIPEAVEDGVEGFLADENDWEAFAVAMHDLAASEKTWKSMAAAARAKIEAKFERSQQVAELEGVYRRLIAG